METIHESRRGSRKNYFKIIPLSYFGLLALVNLVGTAWNTVPSWTDWAFFLVWAIPVLIPGRKVLRTVGTINAILWGYLLLAMTSTVFRSGPIQMVNIIFGYAFISTSFLLSLMLTYSARSILDAAVHEGADGVAGEEAQGVRF